MGPYVLGRTAINRMMRCDWQGEITYKFIKNEYILYSKMLMSSCSIDPTLGFEHKSV